MRRLRLLALNGPIVAMWCLSSVLDAQVVPQSAKSSSKSAPALLQPSDVAEIGLRATVAISGETVTGKQVSGAGFLVESTGVIITNLHVIEGLKKATVTLPNGDAYDRVKIRAYDERKDIAVIQIPGFGLPTLSLGDSDGVKPGESTMLIGHPLGLTASITAGIVSAVRQLDGFRVFQTDAAASPGNSGGPMLNAAGQVVGVLSFGIKTKENLNFVVPINYVRGLLSVDDGLDFETLARRLPAPATPPATDTPPAPTVHTNAADTASTPKPSAIAVTVHALGPSHWGTETTHARVYFYRSTGLAGRVWDPPVFVDDIEVAAMDNKRFFSVWVTPGPHAFTAGGGQTRSCEQPVTGDLKAGYVYYLKLDLYNLACFSLTSKNPEVAAKDIRKLKPLGANDIRHSAVMVK